MDNYLLFMAESYDQAYEGMLDAYDEAVDKSSVYKINYYLRDNLQHRYITNVLKKQKAQDVILDTVAEYIDKHHVVLAKPGPIDQMTFDAKNVTPIYDLFGLTPSMIHDIFHAMIDETYVNGLSKFIVGWADHAPHKILITAILIDAIQNGYDDVIEACKYLWAFSEYPLVYDKSFPFKVKEEVMNYTIEHLGSKWKVKKAQNLKDLLYYDADQSVTPYMNTLKKGVDNVYADFMYRMRNQIKSTLKNIAREYYENDKANASQHATVTTYDDGTIADQEGIATNISQSIDNTVRKFAAGEINNAFVKLCAERNQIDKGNLAGFITQINSNKKNRLTKFIEAIVTVYFSRNPSSTSLGSSEFLIFGLALYRSIGTSKDPLLAEIKSILNFWMNDIINIRSYYNREATIIGYSRAIFDYTVMMIKYYN